MAKLIDKEEEMNSGDIVKINMKGYVNDGGKTVRIGQRGQIIGGGGTLACFSMPRNQKSNEKIYAVLLRSGGCVDVYEGDLLPVIER